MLATLKDDPDGGETAVQWQWYRGGSTWNHGDDLWLAAEDADPAAGTNDRSCDDPSATSASYTPTILV